MDEQPLLPQFSPQKPKKKKRVFFVILIIIALLFGLGVRRYVISRTLHTYYDPVTLQPRQQSFFQSVRDFIFSSDNVLTGQQDDRINILLLGIGGPGHDGPYLSDTNIILSIKPSTNQVAMISVPRDLMAKIDGHGYRRINYADAFGEAEKAGNGGEYARQIFEDTFNIKIPYYIRVDFSAFTDIINTVGGVTINVPKSFTDSSYPGPNDSYETISFTAGIQNMNGDLALKFARSRHGSNGEASDFARAKRQQLILTALKEKVMSSQTYLDPVKMQQIFSSLSSHITTNLNFGQLMYLASLSKDVSNNVKTLVFDDSANGFLRPTISEEGAFLLVPKTGDFASMDDAINNIFLATSTPMIAAPQPQQPPLQGTKPITKIEIQNGTWRLGLAAKTKQRMEEEGYIIASISNTSQRPVSDTMIYVINPVAPAKLLTDLKNQFQTQPTASSTMPSWMQTKPGTEILIILGEDTPDNI
ncbi:MAG: LCP family protein [Patescibacteria group bacterium]